MADLIKYIEQQLPAPRITGADREATHEQSQNNSAKRDETQTDEPKSSRRPVDQAGGSASSDIPSSGAK